MTGNYVGTGSAHQSRTAMRACPFRRWLAGALLACGLVAAYGGTPEADALRARHAAPSTELTHNVFQRPIHLQSTQASSDLQGEVYAVVDQPFGMLEGALNLADRWCDVLILPFNVKQCRATGNASGHCAIRPSRRSIACTVPGPMPPPVAA